MGLAGVVTSTVAIRQQLLNVWGKTSQYVTRETFSHSPAALQNTKPRLGSKTLLIRNKHVFYFFGAVLGVSKEGACRSGNLDLIIMLGCSRQCIKIKNYDTVSFHSCREFGGRYLTISKFILTRHFEMQWYPRSVIAYLASDTIAPHTFQFLAACPHTSWLPVTFYIVRHFSVVDVNEVQYSENCFSIFWHATFSHYRPCLKDYVVVGCLSLISHAV